MTTARSAGTAAAKRDSKPGKLKANTLGLWDVVFMAVATSAPGLMSRT